MGVDSGSDVYKTLVRRFRLSWANEKGTCPKIKTIVRIIAPEISEKFTAYVNSLPPACQKVEQFFHGTKLDCDIQDSLWLCESSSCGVCGIIKKGFDYERLKHSRWQRFGPGFYFAPNSSKCHDYPRAAPGDAQIRATFSCDVAAGNKYILGRNATHLSGPPQGYHSIYGQAYTTGDLNYDELVIFNRNAICPRYIIIY